MGGSSPAPPDTIMQCVGGRIDSTQEEDTEEYKEGDDLHQTKSTANPADYTPASVAMAA